MEQAQTGSSTDSDSESDFAVLYQINKQSNPYCDKIKRIMVTKISFEGKGERIR